MSTHACVACHAHTIDAYLCRTCARHLTAEIRALPALIHQLETTIHRQAVTGTDTRRTPDTTTPLPYHWGAAHTRDDLINTIETWIGELVLDRREIENLAPNLRAGCHWLAAATDRIRMHPAAAEIYDEIIYAIADVRRAIDTPTPAEYYGKCPTCGHDLLGPPGTAEITCRPCARRNITTRIPTAGRRRGMWRHARDQLVPRSVALAALPVYGITPPKPSTWRTWLQRGRTGQGRGITPAQIDTAGRPLYRLGDVLDMAAGPDDTPAILDNALID